MLTRKATEEEKWYTHTSLSRIWRYRSDACQRKNDTDRESNSQRRPATEIDLQRGSRHKIIEQKQTKIENAKRTATARKHGWKTHRKPAEAIRTNTRTTHKRRHAEEDTHRACESKQTQIGKIIKRNRDNDRQAERKHTQTEIDTQKDRK